MSFFSLRAFSNASGPQGYQSTGLCACCNKYGLLSFESRFAVPSSSFSFTCGAAVGAPQPVNRQTRRTVIAATFVAIGDTPWVGGWYRILLLSADWSAPPSVNRRLSPGVGVSYNLDTCREYPPRGL